MRVLPDTTSASDRITERLAALGPMIAELEEAHEDALLSGADFDIDKLASLRREQEDLGRVLNAATRRDRRAVEETRRAERRLAQREILKQGEIRLDAVERAEQAALALVEALKDQRAATKAINAENARLGLPGMVQVSVNESENRISRRLTGMFRPLLASMKFGALRFPNPITEAERGAPWREAEEALATREIARATKD